MERDIHKQYSENNANTLLTIITLFVGLLAIFGSYGYMFLQTKLCSAATLGDLCLGNDFYTIDVLLLISSVALIVCFIIQYICIYVGSTRRYDQFVAHAIRINLGFHHEVLTLSYNPHGKRFGDYLQGLYEHFVRIINWVSLLIVTCTVVKISLYENLSCCSCSYTAAFKFCFCLFSVLWLLMTILGWIYYVYKYNIYRKIQKEYKTFLQKEIAYYKLNGINRKIKDTCTWKTFDFYICKGLHLLGWFISIILYV